jgi:hypothetical protein
MVRITNIRRAGAAFAVVLVAVSAAMLFIAPQPRATAAATSVTRLWPAPVPHWFWTWARWHLGRGEFADQALRDPALRPQAAPRPVPEWAWQRLAHMRGAPLARVPATTLAAGDTGQAVVVMQRALNGARYLAGPADGIFGPKTRSGVIAFEKAHGLVRDGRVDPDEWLGIVRASRPSAPRAALDDYVFVDVRRQILLDVRRGHVHGVVPVSTGGGYTYTGLDERPHVATTPTGTFEVFRKVAGKDQSYLGTLHYPSYFVGGYAIHGSTSVPTQPASHGCVRVPLWLAQPLFERLQIGSTVIVAA